MDPFGAVSYSWTIACFNSALKVRRVCRLLRGPSCRYVIGSGVNALTLAVSEAGHGSIHFYNDPSDISSIALAINTRLEDVQSPENYDGSSRARTVRVGDSVVLVNAAGRVAAVEIVEVTIRDTAADGVPLLTLRYLVTADKDQ